MFVPDTEKLCDADTLPEHLEKALSVPETTIVGVGLEIVTVVVIKQPVSAV